MILIFFCCYITGDISEEAVKCYNKLLEMEPCNGPGLIGMGVKALHDKKYDMAAEKLSQGKICVI